MKLSDVQCPAMLPKDVDVPQSQCASYEITFGLPTYKVSDVEPDEVIIEANCDSCGHQFKVHAHIVVNRLA